MAKVTHPYSIVPHSTDKRGNQVWLLSDRTAQATTLQEAFEIGLKMLAELSGREAHPITDIQINYAPTKKRGVEDRIWLSLGEEQAFSATFNLKLPVGFRS